MKRSMAMIGLVALASGPAQAEHAVPGLRAGLSAMFTNFEGDDVPDPNLGNKFIDDNAVGFKAHVQYQFNDWFALEGAYHKTGDLGNEEPNQFPPEKLELTFHGFSLQGIAYLPWPASEDLQPFVKAGYYDFDDELSDANVTTSSSSEKGLVAGAGMGIEISERFGVRGEFEWFDAEVGDLWSVNIGFEYGFGERAE